MDLRRKMGGEAPIHSLEDVMLNQTTIAALKSELRGELIEPNDTRYDAMRKVYNAMIDRKPRLIARCADAADVIAALKFARELPTVLHRLQGRCAFWDRREHILSVRDQ